MSANDAPIKHDPFGWVYTLLLMSIIFAVAFGIFWAKNEIAIKSSTLWFAYHLRIIQLPFTFLMPDYYRDVLYNLPNLYEELIGTDYPTEYITVFGSIALRSIGMIMLCVCVPRGLYLIMNNDKIMFTRYLDVKKIIEIQREFYVRRKPATKNYLLDVDGRFGHWASALNPIELVAHRGLISLAKPETLQGYERQALESRLADIKTADLPDPDVICKRHSDLSFKDYAKQHFITAKVQPYTQEFEKILSNMSYYNKTLAINAEEVRDFYRKTLGPFCQYQGTHISMSPLPPFERTLWVIFLACISKDPSIRKSIEALLDQLSDSYVEDTNPTGDNHIIDLSGVDELYDKVKNTPEVKIAMGRLATTHAYYYTAFTGLYAVAKKSYGLIKPDDFHWLKVTNRLLFYALDQVTMEVARPESAGIRSHYLAEKKRNRGIGAKIYAPQIESASVNLCHSLALESWLAKPITVRNENPEDPDFMMVSWIENDTEASTNE